MTRLEELKAAADAAAWDAYQDELEKTQNGKTDD